MKYLITFILLGVSFSAFSQWGVGYYQSAIPYLGVNRELGDRWKVEMRLGTNRYVDNLSLEGVGIYEFSQKEDYAFYFGFGLNASEDLFAVLPIGLNIYPFESKKFGFHIEATPMLGIYDYSIFRGSWGIRYRFLKD